MKVKQKSIEKTKNNKKKMSAEQINKQKQQKAHIKLVQNVFQQAGFIQIPNAANKNFDFEGHKGDLDDVFVYENVVVLVEYTTDAEPVKHLKNKIILYQEILNRKDEFFEFMKNEFKLNNNSVITTYHPSKIMLRILYCSLNEIEEKHKKIIDGPIYMDYDIVHYFNTIANAIRKSTRFELLHFLKVQSEDLGEGGNVDTSIKSKTFSAYTLPEAHSNFESGFKIISFYVYPEFLLKTSYVMRKDGWKDSNNLYQRLVIRKKIERIRNYLRTEHRVFVNNIIVTLPPDVKILDNVGNTIDSKKLTKIENVKITARQSSNTIGLIDGQHRVFAYYEAIIDDLSIANLRRQQNLLVTGIVYPEYYNDAQRQKFEAKLFLEVNSEQTTAQSKIKHAINLILNPFLSESIATQVLQDLSKKGPLSGKIQQQFYENDKIKPSSIISYGLKPLVKLNGQDCLFRIWPNPSKIEMEKLQSDQLRSEYIEFCVNKINDVLIALRTNINTERWDIKKSNSDKILSTTSINSFLILIRKIIASGQDLDNLNLNSKLTRISHG